MPVSGLTILMFRSENRSWRQWTNSTQPGGSQSLTLSYTCLKTVESKKSVMTVTPKAQRWRWYIARIVFNQSVCVSVEPLHLWSFKRFSGPMCQNRVPGGLAVLSAGSLIWAAACQPLDGQNNPVDIWLKSDLTRICLGYKFYAHANDTGTSSSEHEPLSYAALERVGAQLLLQQTIDLQNISMAYV